MAAFVTVRTALSADAQAVSNVYLVSQRHFLPYAPVAHPDNMVHRWIADVLIPHGGVSIAIMQGTVVGLMGVQIEVSFGGLTILIYYRRL